MSTVQLTEKRIELWELDDYHEQNNRIFKISYVERGDVRRMEKIFQSKRYLNQYLEDPKNTKIKLYIGDVIESKPV